MNCRKWRYDDDGDDGVFIMLLMTSFFLQSVEYIPGSRECMLRFQVAEVAAKFSQKINRRMVNMSFIRASAIL